MLKDELLFEFANKFYGYGNYESPFWFLGMEEGGGKSVEELNLRFSTWHKRGKRELEDVAEYHVAINIPELFNNRPKIQGTWNKQIRVLLGLTGEENDREVVRDYQKRFWGRNNSENCIIELLPLPSPSTKKWIYGTESNLHFLRNRETYEKEFYLKRVKHVRNRINKFSPEIMVIFGTSYMKYWNQLVDRDFEKIDETFQSKLGKTKLVVLKHPATTGITNAYFYNAGKKLALNL